MLKATLEKFGGLLYHGTFQSMIKEDILPDAKILPCSFVFSIKSTEDGTTKFEAHLNFDGHRDRIKKLMVKFSEALHPIYISYILSLTDINELDVWTSDV